MTAATALVFAVGLIAVQQSAAQECSQHTLLGDRPAAGNPGWHEEAQGLAHDSDYWYVTQNREHLDPRMWRIPVTHDLGAGVACGDAGVSCHDWFDSGLMPPYNHYGDPDFYEFNGRGYVLVPIECGGDDCSDAPPNGVAIFRADKTLEFLAFEPFPGQRSSPWVAVDPDGRLLSSEFGTGAKFNRFYIDWALFQSDGERKLTITPLPPMLLQDEAGWPLDLPNAQGGEFSDDGRLLYLLNGNGRGDALATEGLHVFQTRPGSGAECGEAEADPCIIAQQIEHSHNSSDPGFSYEFHPGANFGASFQEPEGLTFWDLDADGRAPGLTGQLHAVLLDNDVAATDADEVFVKHYRLTDTDTDAPVIRCPLDAVAECSSPSGVAATDPQLSSFFAGASATDVCTGDPTLGNNAPSFFNLGATPVTFTATDDSGNASSCQAQVTIADSTMPEISVVLTPNTLSPPNHKLIRVTAAVSVKDRCDAAVSFQLVSITSDEPDNSLGDGDTATDVQDAEPGTPDISFLLRAERSARGNGRTYTVVYRASDGAGNVRDATAYVRVPRK